MAESILLILGKLLAKLLRLIPTTFDDAFRHFFGVITNLPLVPTVLVLVIVWSVVAGRLIQLRLKRSRTSESPAVGADESALESPDDSTDEQVGTLHEDAPGLSMKEQADSSTTLLP
jgi:hypothetical protein